MTDYNDGNWHNWDKGFDTRDEPVHKESEVEVFGVQKSQGPFHEICPAGHVIWPWVKVFRVTKAHREPREFWIFTHEGEAFILNSPNSAAIHVREVLE